MFGNAYQNGHYFEVWDSKTNNDKNETYKQLVRMIPASNKKYFDKDIKSYIYSLEGQNAKMVLPASDQKQLALHQKYLVLQIFIPVGSPWSMQLGITDINGIKRRINMTTIQGKNEAKYFSLRYPLESLQRGVWMFLAINVHSFIDAFKSQVFRSLDHLTIGSNCLIRRIFMMKQWVQWEIPKGFWFGNQIQQEMQLIQYHQLSLPKINLHKSAHNDQTPPMRSQKQQSIKNSKSNLTRSEITPKLLAKSKIINQSPERPEKSNIEPGKKKSIINERSNNMIINQIKMKEMLKKQEVVKKPQPQMPKHNEYRLNTQKADDKMIKNSPKKSPIVQKSFQEDEAFDYHPDQDSQVNYQTSHESLIYQQPKFQKHYDKWEEEVQPQKNNQMAESETKKSVHNNSKSNRTILTKQNSVKKIGKEENKIELELIYDQMVGCYYHPQTHTYYQIKQ